MERKVKKLRLKFIVPHTRAMLVLSNNGHNQTEILIETEFHEELLSTVPRDRYAGLLTGSEYAINSATNLRAHIDVIEEG
jgi:hypothetical protein